MKKIYLLILTAITLVISSTGYTASTEDEKSMNSSSTMGAGEDMAGMMGGMRGGGMMHQGMMGHHMNQPGVSPVTIMIQPGMNPVMGQGMMHQGTMDGHKGGGMGRDKMKQRQKMMKEHMQRIEQRLAKIEALLSELVELQKKD
jgi:hypothetical protein